MAKETWSGSVEGGRVDYGYYSNPNLTRADISELMAQQHEYDEELERAKQRGTLIAAAITGGITLVAAGIGAYNSYKDREEMKNQIEANKMLAANIGTLNQNLGNLALPVNDVTITEF